MFLAQETNVFSTVGFSRSMSETNVFAQFGFVVMIKKHYRSETFSEKSVLVKQRF